jgi:tetratricopeptide (TPR) repeat protein
MSGAPPPLPPPPPRRPPTSSGVSKPHAALKPHESTASIPYLDSAPPSGNFNDADFLQTSQLPPPPPPPPSRRPLSPPRSISSNNTSNTSTSPESTNLSSFPPPPNVTTKSRETEQEQDGPPSYLPFMTFVPKKQLQVLARRQTHIPILVIATENSNMLAWKNNLQLIDLFQGIVQDCKPPPSQMPPFRSINKSLYPDNVLVQFVEPTHLDPYGYAESHQMLYEHAKLQDADGNVAQELLLLEDRVDELLQDRNTDETLEQVTKDAYHLTSPMDIPWLLRFRYALDQTTNHLSHDLIHCPPLILLVCTSDEVESPQEVLQELHDSPHVLPECFRNGLYNPNAVRHEVLVLHDAVDGPKNFGEQYWRQTLQNQFGPNAAVIRINSVTSDTAKALSEQEDTDLWGGSGTKGNCLSVNDRVLLRRYFQSLMTSAVLPAVERRIADLNALVSERKKGVRNLVKSFWRKPKEQLQQQQLQQQQQQLLQQQQLQESTSQKQQESDSSSTVKYRYDSIESQTRLLADTLFLMQDYEAALSIYRLIRDDYKSDKALAHYANVQEMMGLCMYFMDPYTRSREIFSHFETALLGYTRAAEEERAQWGNDPSARPTAAPHATRLATRLCLLIATASEALTKGRELEVADLLASASSHESSLGAAVLLEQASAFYYHAEMHRKYSFHMLMSGHMFRTAGQDQHAFRCFTSALYVYRHGSWNELHNHLRSALAAQLYSMGRFSVALILYAKLVGTSSGGKVSAKSQQKFLSHLLEVCEKHPKPALAGADRMFVPPKIPNNEREAFRNAQLERIVHVVRFTMGASRVLELPYMNLPKILDSSVRIWTHAEQHFVVDDNKEDDKSALDRFGKVSRGKDGIWEDLELMTTAELNAVDSSRPELGETITSALSKITDRHHRRVIAQVDKEKANRNLIERSKRNGSVKPRPTVRAKGEPLFCDFVMRNPLGVEIFMTEVQLVAKMVNGEERICTNQDAIEINKGGGGSPRNYTFASTDDMEFSVADFCRFSESNQKSCFSAEENPFFVVTKRDMQLPPLGEASISAGLCPLAQGNLEILGVRFKLFDKVWIYHPFDVPGPLLEDTRTNRANRGTNNMCVDF